MVEDEDAPKITPRSTPRSTPRGGKHRPRPPPKDSLPDTHNINSNASTNKPPNKQPESRPMSSGNKKGRPLPKPPLSARNRFNFAALSKRDNIVFGSERPGYVRPNPNEPSTPRGPLVPTPIVEQWCTDMKSKGIKRVLVLLNENEQAFYNEPLIETYGRFFAEVVQLPQNSSATLHVVLEALRDAEELNEPIVVHCSTGQGRTGTILALWLHHRYSLPIPAAVTECMEYANANGAVRKPSIEAIMQLLLGSAQRILPHIRNMNINGGSGNSSGNGGSGGSGTASTSVSPGIHTSSNTPSTTPRLDAKLNITFIQTGGTIDKDYQKTYRGGSSARGNGGGFEFEIMDPAVERVINNVDCAFTYDVESVCRKDGADIDDDDREKMVQCIEKSECMRFIVTHGTEGIIESAKYVDQAGLSPGKVVIFTGAMRPEYFKNSDAHFNIGCALGAVNVLWSGVYVCMNGRVVEAGRSRRDPRTGLFALK